MMTETSKLSRGLEDSLNQVLNWVNSEFKTITLLHLRDEPATGKEIYSRIAENVDRANLPSYPLFDSYCKRSLVPFGAASQTEYRRKKRTGSKYSLTDLGKKVGLPIAAFTLEHVSGSGKSLFEVLGSTASSGEIRAPLTRALILYSLYHGERHFPDIYGSDGRESHVQSFDKGLNALKKAGLVDYQHASGGKVCADFSLNTDFNSWEDLVAWRNLNLLTLKTIDVLHEFESITRKDLSRILSYKGEHDCFNVLNHLAKEGVAVKTLHEHGFTLNLTDEGYDFASQWLVPVIQVLSGDTQKLKQMQDIYDSLFEKPRLLSIRLMNNLEAYAKVCPRYHREPSNERIRKIIDYLQSNPNSRPQDMKEKLGFRPDNFLTDLVKRKIIKRMKPKNIKRAVYSLASRV